ncbi:MAG: polyamine aminopropyltransferase [Candidatus Omnitrophica bacterium]|nr:polyamine aminopropyltransferase [Candidatus Omnitrophota bacterium]
MSKKITLDSREWFFETPLPGVRRCKFDAFKIEKEIYKGKTKFQNIHIFKSPGFGRMLALDNIIQLSESDEFIYHEVITHIPLLSHPSPQRLLVIGGGDGGVIREAIKHPLKEIYQVEIDSQVVKLCKKFLPFVSDGAFSDKRLRLHFEDGRVFINRYDNFFDVIIVDSTDPVGPGRALFRSEFYKSVYKALTPEGIAVFQMGAFIDFDFILRPFINIIKRFFRYVQPIRLCMPSYSCGSEYCFVLASKKLNPRALSVNTIARRLSDRLGRKSKTLRYYTPCLHLASMCIPKFWQP